MKNRLKRLNELRLTNICAMHACPRLHAHVHVYAFGDQVYIVSPALSMDLSQQGYAYNAIVQHYVKIA